MRCPKCGRETPDESKVCMMCGTPFSGQRCCTNCGAIIDPDAVFCPKCGQRQGASMQNTAKPVRGGAAKKHTLRNVLISVAIVIAVFIFLGGDGKKDREDDKDLPIKSSYSSSDFAEAPSIIYTTKAEDNGHENELMFMEGTIGKPYKENGQNVFELSTKAGKIAIISIPFVTPSGAWEKVKEGEWVRVNFMYLGYSDVLDAASGALIDIEEAEPESKSAVVSGTPVTIDADEEEEEDNGSEWAGKFTPINDFYYELDKSNHTITLNKYDGDQKKIMLSPVYTIDGTDYNLKALGDACFFGEIGITSVYIPEGVTSISDNCFNSCADLQYLYLPSTLESVTDGFLDYINEHEIYCDSVSKLPASRDTEDYEERIDDRSSSYQLGESVGGAVNGVMAGFLDGMTETETTTQIYFGGTEKQWKAARRG